MEQLVTGITADSKIMVHGFNSERFNTFLGKLLTIADALGLPKEQADAYKSLVKQEVWNLWEHPAFINEKEWNFDATN